jgi:queuosine precursor transporter
MLETVINAVAGNVNVAVLLAFATAILLVSVKARVWGLIYVALIPLVNWSFTWAPSLPVPGLADVFFNPITVVTGLVLVVRDFAQREMGHKVLFAMALGVGWSAVLAGPELALASGLAFLVSELVDWALFTFTKLRFSSRVFLSSLIAAPVDTTIFLYGAEMIRAGSLTVPNWIASVIGKLMGAAVIAGGLRVGENRGKFA